MQGKWLIATGMFLLSVVFGGNPAFADRVTRQAEITSLSGKVEWLKSGDTNWKEASTKKKLSSGDKIRTGEEGQVMLTLDDGSKIQVFANSEFAVQSLAKDSATEQLESILAVMKCKLRAEVVKQPEGSTFEFETPIMVAAIRGTIPTITVNPDGTVSVADEDGLVDLIREGEINFTAKLETGEEVLVQHDTVAGEIKITSVKGTFEVTGPDGKVYTLNEGDVIIFNAEGAAPFIPLNAPTSSPLGEGFTEPTSGPPTDGPVGDAFDEPVSG